MAVEITGRYTGQLKTEMIHGPSGAVLRTAAPVDNQGDGSSFSPTDLVAAALASCMVTTLAIVAERDGVDLSGVSFRVEKHMAGEPRRIAKLPVTIHLPASLPPAQRAKLERAAQTCPVHRSLGADVEHDVQFVYDVKK
ncbi:MAG TPA: OsmC family protein [Thermoanaerobaculia bacterium]|nr:OsmC family protein [Thermoanaerobaculia bacterium]